MFFRSIKSSETANTCTIPFSKSTTSISSRLYFDSNSLAILLPTAIAFFAPSSLCCPDAVFDPKATKAPPDPAGYLIFAYRKFG